jgi:3-dehydroquinate synthase
VNRIKISPTTPPPAAYDVIVEPGALTRLPSLLAAAAPGHHYLIIADRNLADRYGEMVRAALEGAGFRASLLTFDPGEASKTRETWAQLTDAMVALGAGRDSVVIALGGGVTGDLAGFVAATYLRGVPLVQIPTSLLAMLDSAVGGKTGVDLPTGKNLVGAFHSPRLVVADPLVLETLPLPEIRAGLAEAVKHGAIADAAYFEWIEGAAPRILDRDPEALTTLVRRSVEIKAEFAAADPFETGPRKALNFGHTIGHALEALHGYEIPHGFAVAIGLVTEASLGERLGITGPGTAAQLRRLLEVLGLPTEPPAGSPPEEIVELARMDKKARAARTRYTLLAGIGQVARTGAGEWSHDVDEAEVLALLAVSADRSAV